MSRIFSKPLVSLFQENESHCRKTELHREILFYLHTGQKDASAGDWFHLWEILSCCSRTINATILFQGCAIHCHKTYPCARKELFRVDNVLTSSYSVYLHLIVEASCHGGQQLPRPTYMVDDWTLDHISTNSSISLEGAPRSFFWGLNQSKAAFRLQQWRIVWKVLSVSHFLNNPSISWPFISPSKWPKMIQLAQDQGHVSFAKNGICTSSQLYWKITK